MKLPAEFSARMKAMLGEEFEAFLACMEQRPVKGVRLNSLKCDWETLEKSIPVSLSPTPFSPLCRYAPGLEKPGLLPAHHAGMFYSQEPSASSAVTALDPQPGEKILDLCAAPGGKSTQIAGMLGGEGLLWANEIVRGRANILLSNLERMGAKNAVVSSCHPQKLCETLQGYFDRVLVDAPCSGEGMFRRDETAVREWTPESPAACAQRQQSILDSAALAVKEGGILVYSTCTFSREENEDTVSAFLQRHPEFTLVPIEADFGRPALDGSFALRIFPMDGGEGHFVAKMQRVGENHCKVPPFSAKTLKETIELAKHLYEDLFSDELTAPLAVFGDSVLLLPRELPKLEGLGVLRAGVELGELRGKRIEPAHGLFMSRAKAVCRRALDFSPDDPALSAFLKGEEIDCGESGYTAVCVNGVVTGFGKASGGRLKNRYPKGLRNY
ncbi:MAG: RsmB/NOP family class I SAM-dependent RNA methyltransferase [Acutalibacter sp.]|nr:RsmB/NOP family class I SAM-dependent RNA methyltransferase [Acutalibacter sp.]